MKTQALNEWLDKARVVTAPGLDFGIRRRVGLVDSIKVIGIDGHVSEVPRVAGRIERPLHADERAEFHARFLDN